MPVCVAEPHQDVSPLERLHSKFGWARGNCSDKGPQPESSNTSGTNRHYMVGDRARNLEELAHSRTAIGCTKTYNIDSPCFKMPSHPRGTLNGSCERRVSVKAVPGSFH